MNMHKALYNISRGRASAPLPMPVSAHEADLLWLLKALGPDSWARAAGVIDSFLHGNFT